MSNAGKMIFTFLLMVVMITYLVFRVDATVFDTKKDSYLEAIEAATQVATGELIDTTDINRFYDGNLRDATDIPIDYRALNVYRTTMERVLNSNDQEGKAGVTNINIPLSGFVTYNYIVGVTYDNQYLLPQGYIYEMSDLDVDPRYHGTWNFTLGQTMSITDASGNTKYYRLSNKSQMNSLDPGMENTIIIEPENIEGIASVFLTKNGFRTAEQFSDFVVMSTINDYLNTYAGSDFSNTAKYTGTSMDFELGKSKYSSDLMDYTLESGVVDGPGIFSIIDIYTGSGNTAKLYERIASFGGSELVERTYE